MTDDHLPAPDTTKSAQLPSEQVEQNETEGVPQKALNETNSAWTEEQNVRFEKYGLWCDELLVWWSYPAKS